MEEDQACTCRDNSIDYHSQHSEWSYATQAISNQERWSRSSNHRMHNQKHHLPPHRLWQWIRLQRNVKIGIWWIIWFIFISNIYSVADGGSITKVPGRSDQGCNGKNSNIGSGHIHFNLPAGKVRCQFRTQVNHEQIRKQRNRRRRQAHRQPA